MTDIEKLHKTEGMTDGEQFDPLSNFRQLKFLSLEQIDDFIGAKKNIEKVIGTKPSKLLKSLSCAKWLLEFESICKDGEVDKMESSERKRFSELGKELNLKTNDFPEYTKLVESQGYLDIFDKFVDETNNLKCLNKLLELKSSESLALLQEIAPKVANKVEKKKKLEQTIDHINISMTLVKAMEMLQNTEDLPEDLFGFKKVLQKPEEKLDKTSQSSEQTRSEKEYDKACELLELAEKKGLPNNAYGYKTLSQRIIEFENWQKKFEDYEEWKEKNHGKMHEQLKRSKDAYVIERLKSEFVDTSVNILIPVTEEIKTVNDDIKDVQNWAKRTEAYLNEITFNQCKAKTSFTIKEHKELEKHFNDLKALPCVSNEHKRTITQTAIYHLLSQADEYIIVIKKKSEDDESDEEHKIEKKTFEDWTKLKKQFEIFEDEQMLTRNGIYTLFMRNYTEAIRIHEIVHKNRHKHLKADPTQVENL